MSWLFLHSIKPFTDYVPTMFQNAGIDLSLSGVQYEILKSLAQKSDFDLKSETIRFRNFYEQTGKRIFGSRIHLISREPFCCPYPRNWWN
jgi:hypothetical protein